MGVGLCVAVSKDTAQAAVEAFQAAGEEAVLLGEVVEAVSYTHLDVYKRQSLNTRGTKPTGAKASVGFDPF